MTDAIRSPVIPAQDTPFSERNLALRARMAMLFWPLAVGIPGLLDLLP